MKKLLMTKFAAVAAVVLVATPLAGWGVTVDVTKVQQRYPWNGLVDIDYTITRAAGEAVLDPAKYSVEVTVVNCAETPAVTNVAHVFRQGVLPVSDGAHRVTWDANAEGVNFNSQSVKVFVEIVHYAEKYMVIDVSAGSGDDAVYPVTYLHGAPEGGFNKEEYKGNNIVLRLIPPGSFVMGSPTTETGRTEANEVQHAVAITKPFYIGIFEITQTQYENVMGSNPSSTAGEYHPVGNLSYKKIRGTANTTTHTYDWPHNQDVDMSNSFMGKLRSKCKEWDGAAYAKDVAWLFDLPTDAQWEYACRAGTTSAYNNGGSTVDDLKQLARCKSNGTGKHSAVGSYDPNSWGLYDMHGNVAEWCLDWYQADVQNIKNPSLDPVGPTSGKSRVFRGGHWNGASSDCRSARRNGLGSDKYDIPYDVDSMGFRLSAALP